MNRELQTVYLMIYFEWKEKLFEIKYILNNGPWRIACSKSWKKKGRDYQGQRKRHGVGSVLRFLYDLLTFHQRLPTRKEALINWTKMTRSVDVQ